MARGTERSVLRHPSHDMATKLADAATASHESPPLQAHPQLWEKTEGRFVCLEQHPDQPGVARCGKEYASKQALEAHRARVGCEPAKLPSDRAVSRLHGLGPPAVRAIEHQSNHAAVTKYRRTVAGEWAVFRARHIAKYRLMALAAIPTLPTMPDPPRYIPPPISWLIADRQIPASEVRTTFDSGRIQLSHASWSLRFHPDKVQVSHA